MANSFAPPVGSRPQFRALKELFKSHLNGRAFPVAFTFAVTYRCQCNCSHCSAGNHLRKDTSEMLTREQREEIYEYSARAFMDHVIPPLSSQSWQNSLEAWRCPREPVFLLIDRNRISSIPKIFPSPS